MATIKARKQASGETRYTAIVRVRKGQAVVHSEAKTFTHQPAARSWAKHREVALEDPEELRRAQEPKQSSMTTYQLKTLIKWYIDSFRHIGKWQRTKQTTLEVLVHFAAQVKSFSVFLWGASEDPDSPHFNDQSRLASERRLRPNWFEPQELAARVVSSQLLATGGS